MSLSASVPVMPSTQHGPSNSKRRPVNFAPRIWHDTFLKYADSESLEKITIKTIGVAAQRRGLYAFENLTPVQAAFSSVLPSISALAIQPAQSASSFVLSSTSALAVQPAQLDNSELWQLRLGHIPHDRNCCNEKRIQ
ncbi:uncharacterized protein [Arachis hypogaea]|uniref:uncharacterized protein n=1 Tax=Arachis hypogaea TaxID=3818 RepID=UPI000DEC8EF3|nr:uncharacterized protein LOC112707278 [Arachis hypogaea]QHO31570.1 uncharacterized protein DS421_8g242710 [Arachis hypogaea]